MTISRFQKKILDWYKTHRRDFQWRKTKDPYKILVSEVMLQQTQISRVLPKYKEFLRAFPTLQVLAKAPNKKLLKVWAGLGYWRRTLLLKEAAKQIISHTVKNQRSRNFYRNKQSPWKEFSTPRALEKLPGVGPYTARALACFAFESREAFLDTNIRRVYLYFFFPSTRSARSGQAPKKVSDKEILKIAQKALNSILSPCNKLSYKMNAREWHYALFDYGATVLKDKNINRRSRSYHKQSKFEGSFRSFRAKVVHFLLSRPASKASRKTLFALLESSPYPPQQILSSLLKDGLVKKRGHSYSI